MSVPKLTESIPVASRPVTMPEPSKASVRANFIVATLIGAIAVVGAVVGIAVTW